jgi:thiamine-phosphate pyrophosphorylase
VHGLKLGLYVITYTDPASGRNHLDVARAALEGDADVIQLRAKELGGREMFNLASRIGDMAGESRGGCLFIVNDRIDIAQAAGADGVHLGQGDISASAARSLIGEEMIMGISATTVEEAMAAQANGADYLGVGPVFATPSKADAVAPIGLEGLSMIREAVDLPIVAIGGIAEENTRQVMAAGADGIAVISAVTGAEHMSEAVRRLRSLVDDCLSGR